MELSKKSKIFIDSFIKKISAYIFAPVKKALSLFFIFIFMLQALPVMHWVCGDDENNVSIEMNNEKDNGEKDNTEKEQGKDCKENIIPNKHFHGKYLVYKSTRLSFLASENAVILHHADITTPPPDING